VTGHEAGHENRGAKYQRTYDFLSRIAISIRGASLGLVAKGSILEHFAVLSFSFAHFISVAVWIHAVSGVSSIARFGATGVAVVAIIATIRTHSCGLFIALVPGHVFAGAPGRELGGGRVNYLSVRVN